MKLKSKKEKDSNRQGKIQAKNEKSLILTINKTKRKAFDTEIFN
jgi:hypothetical protein